MAVFNHITEYTIDCSESIVDAIELVCPLEHKNGGELGQESPNFNELLTLGMDEVGLRTFVNDTFHHINFIKDEAMTKEATVHC